MKQLLEITPAAGAHIAGLMAQTGAIGLRLGIKKGGCAGMEYTVDLAHDLIKGEERVEMHGACVIIPPSATLFLIGMNIDYQNSLLESGLKFINPNVDQACGCGESVSFKV